MTDGSNNKLLVRDSGHGLNNKLLLGKWKLAIQIPTVLTLCKNQLTLQAINGMWNCNELVTHSSRLPIVLFADQNWSTFTSNNLLQGVHAFLQKNKGIVSPAVVAWFVGASVFHSVNSASSANGGSNPAWECCIDRLNSKEFVTIQIARRQVLFGGWCDILLDSKSLRIISSKLRDQTIAPPPIFSFMNIFFVLAKAVHWVTVSLFSWSPFLVLRQTQCHNK